MTLTATHLTDYELGRASADPMVKIAPGITSLFPDRLDDPTVCGRFYIVAVPRRHVDFVGVVAAPSIASGTDDRRASPRGETGRLS